MTSLINIAPSTPVQVPIGNDTIYAGGSWTTYKTLTENRVILLNPDATKDTTFDNTTGFNGSVEDFAIDSNDKLYVCGAFTTYKGVAANSIIRLNSDGTKDTGFDNTTGFDDTAYCLAIDSNGKIYVGGQFTTYKGVAANGIIRLNPDGTKDTGFDNTTGFGANNFQVLCLAIDSNGKIYVGGSYTLYKGVAANYIIRLNPDGTKDTTFDNSTGFNGITYGVGTDSNGKIYVAGIFTSYKGTTANRIICLNSDGTKDTTFDNTTGFSSDVYALTIDRNNKIYVGGAFTSYKGTTANRIIRLNSDGSKDTGFDNTTGFSGTGTVESFAIDSNDNIYVGGGFTTYKGVAAVRIVCLNPNGSRNTTFDSTTGFGANNTITTALKVRTTYTNNTTNVGIGNIFTISQNSELGNLVSST